MYGRVKRSVDRHQQRRGEPYRLAFTHIFRDRKSSRKRLYFVRAGDRDFEDGRALGVRPCASGWKEHPPEAYVFGDDAGQRVKSVRTAWENARDAAGLQALQLRDLRHEAGSRFDEAGVSVNYVSKILGHTNLNTTTRYLNIHRRGLHDAMQKLEALGRPLHSRCTTATRTHKTTCRRKALACPPKPHTCYGLLSWCGREDLNLHDLAATSS